MLELDVDMPVTEEKETKVENHGMRNGDASPFLDIF